MGIAGQCRQNHGEQQERSDARRSAGLSLDEIVASRDARCEQAKRCDQPDAVWIAARTDHAAAPDCATSCAIQPRTASPGLLVIRALPATCGEAGLVSENVSASAVRSGMSPPSGNLIVLVVNAFARVCSRSRRKEGTIER